MLIAYDIAVSFFVKKTSCLSTGTDAFSSNKDTKSGGVGTLHPPLHSESYQTQTFVGKFMPT